MAVILRKSAVVGDAKKRVTCKIEMERKKKREDIWEGGSSVLSGLARRART